MKTFKRLQFYWQGLLAVGIILYYCLVALAAPLLAPQPSQMRLQTFARSKRNSRIFPIHLVRTIPWEHSPTGGRQCAHGCVFHLNLGCAFSHPFWIGGDLDRGYFWRSGGRDQQLRGRHGRPGDPAHHRCFSGFPDHCRHCAYRPDGLYGQPDVQPSPHSSSSWSSWESTM